MYCSQDKKTETETKNSKYHTLFKETSGEEKTEVTIDGKKLFKITPAHTKYRFFISSFDEDERGLHDIFNTLWNAGSSDTLELRINSWGGSVTEGHQLTNIIKNKFFGRTTTILDNVGYSMGALTFMLGDVRIAMEESELMIHDYSTFYYGKGGELDVQVEHTSKHIRNFFRKIVVEQGFLTEKEFENLVIGKDYWMNTEEMCRRGIATHVMTNGKKIKVKKYLKRINKIKKSDDNKKQKK